MEQPTCTGEDDYKFVEGEIHSMEVENFKSYKGRQTIGPFKKFTAVIGPNGSGKSNLMDAISFVLGVKTQQLRGSKLKELVHAAHSSSSTPARAHVKLLYQTRSGEEVAFSRHLQPSSNNPDAAYQSVYKINDIPVSADAYTKRLASYGIMVKLENCLVFQGYIEQVAQKSPIGLTELFEQISGSGALKKDFEELEVKKQRAEEKVSLLYSKKKNVTTEKKQKKEQKDEAERHMKMRQELLDVKTLHYLCQLYYIAQDMKVHASAKSQLDAEIAAKKQEHAEYDANSERLKQEHAAQVKKRMVEDQKLRKLEKSATNKGNRKATITEELKVVEKRVATADKNISNLQKELKDQEDKVKKLEADLQKLEALRAKTEADFGSEDGQGGLNLKAEHQKEYQRLKAEAGAETTNLVANRDNLEAQCKANDEGLRTRRRAVEQIQKQLEKLAGNRSELLQRIAEQEQNLQSLQAMKESASTQLRAIQDKERATQAKRERWEIELKEIDEKLGEARADKRDSEREARLKNAISQLKAQFPGRVHGRLTELGQAVQQRYNLALTIVLGRHIDSVVVDTERTARECVEFLKANKIDRLTFIPLDTCKVRQPDEGLRQLGGTARLAVDLVNIDEACYRGLLFACEDTVVCDSDEEMKRVHQRLKRTGQHVKVVSTVGTMIAKGGAITGGVTHALESKSRGWDEKVIEALKNDRKKKQDELHSLDSKDALAAERMAASAQVDNAEVDIKYTGPTLQKYRENLLTMEGQIAALTQQLEEEQPELQSLERKLAEAQEQVAAVKQRIDDITDRVFADFSKKVKVKSIREYEERHLEAFNRMQAELDQLDKQIVNVTSALSFEKAKKDTGKRLEAAQQQRERDLRSLKEGRGKLEQVEAEVADYEAKIEASRQKMDDLAAAAARLEEEKDALKKQGVEFNSIMSKLNKQLEAEERALDALKDRRAELLSVASLEQVSLPKRGQKRRRQQRQNDEEEEDEEEEEEEEEDEEMADAEDAADDEAGPSTSSGVATYNFDYSLLKRPHTAASSQKERNEVLKGMANKMDELQSALEAGAPNLKAMQQYSEILQKEKEHNQALEAARMEAQNSINAFNQVRQRRLDRFREAFEHISTNIDPIYKDLTRSTVHKMGGQAYLSLESNEEPFLHGIKYTAMPPSKRYRDMADLSGGEKTVAALALLFAIHSFRPSPFFVLDEVDAALDATNVARVAHYIRRRTRQGAENGFQGIVISLKDNFYEKADGLVGVCKDMEAATSKTFTFDLEPYGPPQPQ